MDDIPSSVLIRQLDTGPDYRRLLRPRKRHGAWPGASRVDAPKRCWSANLFPWFPIPLLFIQMLRRLGASPATLSLLSITMSKGYHATSGRASLTPAQSLAVLCRTQKTRWRDWLSAPASLALLQRDRTDKEVGLQ